MDRISSNTLVAQQKAALRREVRENRARLFYPEAGDEAAQHFMAALADRPGERIALYWAHGSELETRALAERLHAAGHLLGLPVVAAPDSALEFHVWAPGGPLIPGRYGILEPDRDGPVMRPEIVVVPLLAFDNSGYRLGYGGGYYDRTLQHLRSDGACIAAGFAYAGQQVSTVPVDEFDQPLDWIVTDKGARKIS